MTRIIDGVMIISPEIRECAFCHTVADVRPYGPDRKDICAPCAALPQYADIVEVNLDKRLEGVKHLMVAGYVREVCSEV